MILKKYSLGIFIFLLVSCGYKPATTYTSPILGDKIKTEVDINVKNPVDAVFLKDALNEAVIGVFNGKISNSNYESFINLKINSVHISAIDYDKNGYPILYKAVAVITANVKDINSFNSSYQGKGNYEFSVDANAVLSDDIKHNAIKEAFLKALQMIEFKIAQKGIE